MWREGEGWSKGATAVKTVSPGDERLKFGSQIVRQPVSQSHDPLFQTTVFDPDCSLTLDSAIEPRQAMVEHEVLLFNEHFLH